MSYAVDLKIQRVMPGIDWLPGFVPTKNHRYKVCKVESLLCMESWCYDSICYITNTTVGDTDAKTFK